MNLLKQVDQALDNRKTYILCALWLLAWWAAQHGYITIAQYDSIFGQTGPIFPAVIAAIRGAIGENK